MTRDSHKERTILCRYDPTEIGEYIIHVKWSGKHVPGSPFHVNIVDTRQELESLVAMSSLKMKQLMDDDVSQVCGNGGGGGMNFNDDFWCRTETDVLFIWFPPAHLTIKVREV